MSAVAVSPYLAVWTVVSLRPGSQQAAVRRAIEARGARALAVPALRLDGPRDRERATTDLLAARACEAVIFTSPAAVNFAHRLSALHAGAWPRVVAVGSGTARELERLGITAITPAGNAMNSEGVLALDAVAAARSVGIVTAPGGQGAIASRLRADGREVCIAEVYRRAAVRWGKSEFDAIDAARAPFAVMVSSAEALAAALAELPAGTRAKFVGALALVASERLAEAAQAAGFHQTLVAASATPDAMLDALDGHVRGAAAHANAGSIR